MSTDTLSYQVGYLSQGLKEARAEILRAFESLHEFADEMAEIGESSVAERVRLRAGPLKRESERIDETLSEYEDRSERFGREALRRVS